MKWSDFVDAALSMIGVVVLLAVFYLLAYAYTAPQ